MEISFKQDLGGTYGGARWLSPPFKSGLMPAENAGVDARALGVDRSGKVTKISPVWAVSAPENIVISDAQPGEHTYVRLSVKRPGESAVTVTSELGSITLRVRATYASASAMQLEIDR